MLTRDLAGYQVTNGLEQGPKTLRAAPVAAQVNAGNVSLVRAGWNVALLDELEQFPDGAKDDQIDALARAFAMLTETAQPARFTNFAYLAR
jgi:predicted phage terminase large subunit-like protein